MLTWKKGPNWSGAERSYPLALDSLTFGAPLIWLHRSLGLGPELCACLRFPFTNSCSFLSFFCLPAGSKIFCALLHSTPVPSPESLLSHRQWTAGKGRGAGAGAGLVLFGVREGRSCCQGIFEGAQLPQREALWT